MTKKTKWILKACGIALVIFIAACWYCDYRDFHEAIEVETPEVGDEVRG